MWCWVLWESIYILWQSSPWGVMLILSRFIDWILEKMKNISIYFCALYILCVSKYPRCAKKWFTLREFYSSIYQMPSIYVAKICVIASLLSVFSLHFPINSFWCWFQLFSEPAFFTLAPCIQTSSSTWLTLWTYWPFRSSSWSALRIFRIYFIWTFRLCITVTLWLSVAMRDSQKK